MHTDESRLAQNRAALEKRLGIKLPEAVVSSSDGIVAGFLTIAIAWAVFSIGQGIRYLLVLLWQTGPGLAVVGMLLVVVFGGLGFLLFHRVPRFFGLLQLSAAMALGGVFVYRMSEPQSNKFEQAANLVGAIFLFVDGTARFAASRRKAASSRATT